MEERNKYQTWEDKRGLQLPVNMATGIITLDDLKLMFPYVNELPQYDQDNTELWSEFFHHIMNGGHDSMSSLLEGGCNCKDEEDKKLYNKFRKIVINTMFGVCLIEKDNIVITKESNRIIFKPVELLEVE